MLTTIYNNYAKILNWLHNNKPIEKHFCNSHLFGREDSF